MGWGGRDNKEFNEIEDYSGSSRESGVSFSKEFHGHFVSSCGFSVSEHADILQ